MECSALVSTSPHGVNDAKSWSDSQVDESGRYTGDYYTFALAGFIRKRGEGQQRYDPKPRRSLLVHAEEAVRAQGSFWGRKVATSIKI